MRPEGLCQWKIPVTQSGIEPATCRLLGQPTNRATVCCTEYVQQRELLHSKLEQLVAVLEVFAEIVLELKVFKNIIRNEMTSAWICGHNHSARNGQYEKQRIGREEFRTTTLLVYCTSYETLSLCFPTCPFFARGSLLTSKNNYGSSHPCWRKYAVYG